VVFRLREYAEFSRKGCRVAVRIVRLEYSLQTIRAVFGTAEAVPLQSGNPANFSAKIGNAAYFSAKMRK